MTRTKIAVIEDHEAKATISKYAMYENNNYRYFSQYYYSSLDQNDLFSCAKYMSDIITP